jgi:hypothetical protein
MDRKTEDLLDNKSISELLDVTLREVAKASNEIRSAQNDIAKAQSRMRFCVLLLNRLKERENDGFKSNSN